MWLAIRLPHKWIWEVGKDCRRWIRLARAPCMLTEIDNTNPSITAEGKVERTAALKTTTTILTPAG